MFEYVRIKNIFFPNKNVPSQHCFIFTFTELMFYKKFSGHWTPEVFIHTPGNEIGLIEHFWAAPVQHLKMIPTKEIELLLSVKHEVSNSQSCLPDIALADFVKCFKSKLKEQVNIHKLLIASVYIPVSHTLSHSYLCIFIQIILDS